jgi:hypothetical protein
MNTNQSMPTSVKPGEQLWGIYYNDREFSREMGDPLRAVIAARTKITAEETAAQLGLDSPWAHPLTPEQIQSIRESEIRRSEESRITLQPTTAEIRTAVEVLKVLDQRLNEQASHSISQLPKTDLGDQYAEQIEARNIEQTGHIGKVVTQLQNWREELLQEQSQRTTQSV